MSVRILNHQPASGHFSWNVSVMNGDTVNRVKQRMQKEKYVKGMSPQFCSLQCAIGRASDN